MTIHPRQREQRWLSAICQYKLIDVAKTVCEAECLVKNRVVVGIHDGFSPRDGDLCLSAEVLLDGRCNELRGSRLAAKTCLCQREHAEVPRVDAGCLGLRNIAAKRRNHTGLRGD